jgi:hypothetical protein
MIHVLMSRQIVAVSGTSMIRRNDAGRSTTRMTSDMTEEYQAIV